MEPTQPNQQPTPEQGPGPAQPEQVPAPTNQPPVPAAPAPVPAAPAPPAPVPQVPIPPAAKTTGAPTPAAAEDVDVIEKEWVDAAQEVVQKNAEDPYKEEEGFENLQVDYLKKRYGKDIKKTDS